LKHSVYYQNLLTEINELQKINRLCAFRILKQCKYKFINTFLKGFLALFFAFVLFRIQSDRWLLLVIMGTRYSVHRVLRDVKSIRIAFVDIGGRAQLVFLRRDGGGTYLISRTSTKLAAYRHSTECITDADHSIAFNKTTRRPCGAV